MRIEARFGDDERAVTIEADEWHPEAELEPWLAAFQHAVECISRRPGVVHMPGRHMTGDPILDDPALDPHGGTGERR